MSGAVNMSNMTQILVFGDSIVYGAWDPEGGWVQRLRKFVDTKNLSEEDYYCLVYNLGIDGGNSETLLKRFENEIKPRIWEDEETVIIFAFGGNDAIKFLKTGKNQTDPDKFKINVEELIIKARKFTSKILFVGTTPVDEAKVNPMPWLPEGSCINEERDKFKNIVKAVCKEKDIDFLDIAETWPSDYKEKFLEDGDHPNSEGHKKIFEEVKKILLDKKLI